MHTLDRDSGAPRVVVVGGGFGGLEVVKRLRRASVRVTLVDRNNYHLFQPLLYQVATAGLSPANIATPLRSLLRKQNNCEVFMAEVVDVDPARKKLLLADGELDYDFLVVAAGATHSYFGHDQWESVAPGLKTIADATRMRRTIFRAFEAAEREPDSALRDELLTFIIVGAGPTGVELAGTLAEIAKHTLKYDFRHIDPQDAKIYLIEAGPQVLGNYPSDLARAAARKIEQLGVQILTHTKVVHITHHDVLLGNAEGEHTIRAQTVLWAAGVQAVPLGKKIATACDVATDRIGRVPVTERLSIAGHENIYVIGDLASCLGADGRPLPGLAPVAIQQGKYVADRITQQLGKPSSKRTLPAQPFKYRDPGTMATIGRAAAVAQIGRFKTCGWFAWILWLGIHLMQIVQFHNRLLVLFQWAWNYLTYGRSARLIIEDSPTAKLPSDRPRT